MDYQCEVSYSLPPALHYLWWQIAFSGGAYGARTQHHTIRILCLRQVTLHWNTPPGMVMLSTTGVTSTPSGMVMLLIPRVTLTPLSDGKDTLEKCYSTLRQVGMHGSLCIANLSTQNNPTVPGPLWVWIPPMSTYIRVLCYLLNYHRGTLKTYSALRLDGLTTTTLTLVQP